MWKFNSAFHYDATMGPGVPIWNLMMPMEDSSLRQLWWLADLLVKIRKGGLTQRDVKNGECSGWLIENKGEKKVLWMS